MSLKTVPATKRRTRPLVLGVRFSETELDEIRAAAAAKNVDLSTYVRALLLGHAGASSTFGEASEQLVSALTEFVSATPVLSSDGHYMRTADGIPCGILVAVALELLQRIKGAGVLASGAST